MDIDAKSLHGVQFNVKDQKKFQQALSLLKESLWFGEEGLFSADNMITWNRNLSFLQDEFYTDIFDDPATSQVEKSIIWRWYIAAWFAEYASRLEGDFMEVGCYTGHTASVICKRVALNDLDKNYYLYDLFEWNEGDAHPWLADHDSEQMYEDTCKRFECYENVHVIKGRVPDTFEVAFPEQVAFAHIDMNNAPPEEAALRAIYPRLVKGGVILFDDYGWFGYCSQKRALDEVTQELSRSILELPTGQGVLLKS